MASRALRFSHPIIGDLELSTGLDTAAWGYTLNTMTYPTYGGEVVQILSCQIDDLNLAGTFRTYREMESFYTYMMRYMQVASQGLRGPRVPGKTAYNQEAMKFLYPERGWNFLIMPTSAPGFRRGTEVVTPTWQMQAHVIDHTGDVEALEDLIITENEIRSVVGADGSFSETFSLEGKIGYDPDNPFSDPFTDVPPDFDLKKVMADEAEKIGDAYVQVIKQYLDKKFDAIMPDFSKPTQKTEKKVDVAKSVTDAISGAIEFVGDTAKEEIQVVKAKKRRPK